MNKKKKIQSPLNAQQTLELLNDNPQQLREGCLFIVMAGVCCIAAFISLSMYIFSVTENHFFQTAVEANAIVKNVSEQRSVTERGNGNNSTYEVTYIKIIHLSFTDERGKKITAKASDDENSILQAGDEVKILYDPENPRQVRFFKDRHNASTLKILFYIFGTVSVLSGVGSFFLYRKSKFKAQA